ncbi:hypothetical protein [Stenotrophomonas nematodicola]|jgi:hypothetical protein|uniref:hypothetical protein n=1 Tax=Stenotrophomonas nematodicola TaxID=2656746 RepID=UPI003D9A0C63
MNVLRAAVCLCLLSSAAVAWAQSPSECPSLPAGSGLQWQQQAQSDFMLCKASTADGREVLSLILSARDPALTLTRTLRQEKGGFAGESMYWYQPDLGGQKPPGYDTRRVAVVKFDKNRYAQIALYADNAQELDTLQSLTQSMNLTPTAVAAGR